MQQWVKVYETRSEGDSLPNITTTTATTKIPTSFSHSGTSSSSSSTKKVYICTSLVASGGALTRSRRLLDLHYQTLSKNPEEIQQEWTKLAKLCSPVQLNIMENSWGRFNLRLCCCWRIRTCYMEILNTWKEYTLHQTSHMHPFSVVRISLDYSRQGAHLIMTP